MEDMKWGDVWKRQWDEAHAIPFKIEDFEDSSLIDKRLDALGYEGNRRVGKIKAGFAAYKILKGISIADNWKDESSFPYKDKVVHEESFDPVCADENVNPILPTGYRLSSYIMYMTVFWLDEKGMNKHFKMIKFIPVR
jgi:hypothetical protein